jgi:uncharacterized UPF0160 family protein
VLVFDTFAPWKEHLFEVETEAGLTEDQKPVRPDSDSLAPSSAAQGGCPTTRADTPPPFPFPWPLYSRQLYVLYPEESGRAWRIQAVPESAESFMSRKAMPEPCVPFRNFALQPYTR